MKRSALLEIKKEKKQFVRDNMVLFEKAYLGYKNGGTRYKRKLHNSAYSEFITIARKKFNYSPKTSSVDIWTKFQFPEINAGINDRERVKKFIFDLKLKYTMGLSKQQKNLHNSGG